MSLLLMKDPKKLAALLLEKRGKVTEAPKSEDGHAIKESIPTGRAAFVSDMFSAIDARDAESFINAFKQLSQSVADEARDDSPSEEPSHHDLPTIEDLTNGDSSDNSDRREV